MSEDERLKEQIRKLAASMRYPETPDLAGRVAPKPSPLLRWALPVATLIAVVAVAIAAPPVRAALVEVFGVGSVEIVLGEPTPTAERVRIDLPGETTLEAARAASSVHVPLAPDLGSPDRVFVLSQVWDTVVLVWEHEGIALYVIPSGAIVQKLGPESVERTQVHGRPAIWATGDHFLELVLDDPSLTQFITGHVLIWTDEGVTYRLETELPLVDAILIAESLK